MFLLAWEKIMLCCLILCEKREWYGCIDRLAVNECFRYFEATVWNWLQTLEGSTWFVILLSKQPPNSFSLPVFGFVEYFINSYFQVLTGVPLTCSIFAMVYMIYSKNHRMASKAESSDHVFVFLRWHRDKWELRHGGRNLQGTFL